MEKLNLIKILKDCPKGTKFYSPVYGKIEFIGIETFASSDPITIKWFKDENTTFLEYLRADGTFRGLGECIIFPSEEQRDWSKWQRPFVKGDVLVSEAGNIVLCSHIDENQLVHYHCLLNFLDILKIRDDIGVGYSYECTLANDFQKQKLFDALKKEGYEWDAETKTLEKLIVPKFKVGDKVVKKGGINIPVLITEVSGENYYSNTENSVGFFKIKEQDNWELVPTHKFNIGDRIKHKYFRGERTITSYEKHGYWTSINDCIDYEDEDDWELLVITPKFKVGDKIRHKSTGDVYKIVFVLSNGYGGGVYDVAITNEIGKSIDVKEQDDYELVPNKFDISTLIPYESKVLIRHTIGGHWQPAFWGAYITDHSDGLLQHHDYLTTKGFTNYCIPYDGNEHLIGKTYDCCDFYKTWEE